MGIFNKNAETDKSVRNNHPIKVKNKILKRKFEINGESCTITMQEVKIAEIEGNEKLLDEDLVNKTFEDIMNAVKRNSSKYNPVPKNIVICSDDFDKSNNSNLDEKSFVNCYKPKWSLDDVYIDESSKRQIISALTISKHKDKLFNEWGLENSFKNGRTVILNFFGPPGTGKSMAAEAIADYLGKEVCSVNYAQLESKYVGETPKNIKKVFETASLSDAVIIFDEADSFLGKRIANVTQSADYGVNITRSVMLMELERFDGVVIFTTNLISNYDDAFKRRILASIEFYQPDKKGREIIWRTHIPQKLPLDNNITAEYLAGKYENISGADIKDIILNASVLCLQRGSNCLNIDDFDVAYKFIANRYNTGNIDTMYGNGSNIKIKTEKITKEEYEREVNESYGVVN